jgi:endonuclease/exonuclease/phosphatase (EEP) superfamily protein YafD
MRAALGALAKLGALALATALLLGWVGRWAWPFELFANFRVQYAALLFPCAAILLALKQYKWGLGTALGAILTAASVFAYAGWPDSAQAGRDPAAFRLITFNVWFRNTDLRRLATYLEQSAADAAVLLELDRSSALQLRQLLPSYGFSQIGSEPHGAVIFSRWPLRDQAFESLCAGCVSIASARLDWQGRTINLLGAHLHWPIGPTAARLRARELQGLAQLVRQRGVVTLLGGDFNLTPWSRYFDDFLDGSGLQDCAKHQGWKPTWPRAAPLLGIRIDHCFASPGWQTVRVSVGPPLGSDHLPNVVDLTLPAPDRRSERGRYAELRRPQP